jgi:hypothetical protein
MISKLRRFLLVAVVLTLGSWLLPAQAVAASLLAPPVPTGLRITTSWSNGSRVLNFTWWDNASGRREESGTFIEGTLTPQIETFYEVGHPGTGPRSIWAHYQMGRTRECFHIMARNRDENQVIQPSAWSPVSCVNIR